jgi:hypothetical protein
MLEPFASAFSGQPLDASASPPSSNPSQNADELQRMVRNLQAEVEQLKRPPPGKPPATRRKPRAK